MKFHTLTTYHCSLAFTFTEVPHRFHRPTPGRRHAFILRVPLYPAARPHAAKSYAGREQIKALSHSSRRSLWFSQPSNIHLIRLIKLFGKKPRRRAGKLLGDGTQQPAMWGCPAHVDELTLERVIKAGRLWGNCEALRQQAPLDLALIWRCCQRVFLGSGSG